MSTSSTFLRMIIVAAVIALVTLVVLAVAGADPAQELSVATKIYVG
jgi:hypothetical protein